MSRWYFLYFWYMYISSWDSIGWWTNWVIEKWMGGRTVESWRQHWKVHWFFFIWSKLEFRQQFVLGSVCFIFLGLIFVCVFHFCVSLTNFLGPHNINGSCLTWTSHGGRGMSHMNKCQLMSLHNDLRQMHESCHFYERVTAHIWMRHVTCMNESCLK